MLLAAAAPALGQHAHHQTPAEPVRAAPEATEAPAENPHAAHPTMDHGSMDHGAPDQGAMNHDAPTATEAADHNGMDHSAMGPAMPETAPPMDHSNMDHSKMDHSKMDHSAMGHGSAPADIPMAPPPAAAGSGPPRAADAIWGAAAMRASREALAHENGGMSLFWFQGDRAELRVREGHDGYLWDVQGYYGGDIDKFWFKSEGEGSFGEAMEGVEVQALWSHAIGPFADLQLGLRQDFAPRDRTYAVIGVQGLAPYNYEYDVAAFVSDKGDLTARAELELDQRITQRLILQPRGEAVLSAQDIPELGIGAGVDKIELGLRLRYEFAREFAPYLGIEQEWKLGQSADYARAAGEDASVTNFVAGIRFWF
nr:copper resistance protein B [Pacificimonas pallii]